MTAKAPLRESFNISSFFSLGWCEESASTVSIYPSICIPPVMRSGRQAATAANNIPEAFIILHSQCHEASAAAQNRPTTGRKQIAFLGYNRISMSSLKFEETFRRFYPSEHLFENYGSIDELCNRFLTQHEKFDSVICFIDKIAIVLMNKASQRNLAIPEELYVMSFGGTRISQFCTPALTTVSLNYYQCGCTAVSMISLLHTSEQDPVHITLQNDFYTRASTAELPFVPAIGLTPVSYNENVEEITQDQNFLDIGKLERLFTYCDNVDMQILQKLWENKTYEQISEELPMAITTIYYRLRKLLQHADIRGKQELFQLLDHYNIRLKAAE